MASAIIQPELTGICENMPPESRIEREEILLQLLQDELQARGGSGDFDSVLSAVAGQQRIAVSQVKHGLNRGIALGSLELMADPGDSQALIVSCS